MPRRPDPRRANPKSKTKEVPVINTGTIDELNDKIPDILKPGGGMVLASDLKTRLKAKIDARKIETAIKEEGKHRVSIMKDHLLQYPSLGLEVFIAGDTIEEATFAEMFARSHCKQAKSIIEADLVVFTGGADVEPAYYGEKTHPKTHFLTNRDDYDIGIYVMCLENGIPMLGICRGAQFLAVMGGGKLYQDVDNHYGDHPIWDIKKKDRIDRASSVHHQMVRRFPEMDVVAVGTRNQQSGNGVSQNRWLNDKDHDIGSSSDVEAFVIRDTCCIGIQGHPEYSGYNYFTKWSLELVEDTILNNPDLALVQGNWRIKPELLAERQGKIQHKIQHKM